MQNDTLQTFDPAAIAGEWHGYARAAGLAALTVGTVAAGANAAVIVNMGTFGYYTDARTITPADLPIVINPVSYTGVNPFDFDGDGVQDLRLGTGNYNQTFANNGSTAAGTVFTSATPEDYLRAFAPGATIDATATVAGVKYGGNQIATVDFTSGGFLGFQTSLGFFGYLDLLIEPGAVANGNKLNARITVRGFAYEDTGAPIAAGALGGPGGDVPEPTSLALLAAGTAGLAIRRGKRKPA